MCNIFEKFIRVINETAFIMVSNLAKILIFAFSNQGDLFKFIIQG